MGREKVRGEGKGELEGRRGEFGEIIVSAYNVYRIYDELRIASQCVKFYIVCEF